MNFKRLLTWILAVTGTVLVWLPILVPVLFAVLALAAGRGFLLDYLMPAELFPLVLAGAVLLIWAAIWAHSRVKLIGWALGAAIALLLGGQALAEVTGLASGAIEPTGIWWALVLASLAAYVFALVVIGVGGLLLLRDLFKPSTGLRPAV